MLKFGTVFAVTQVPLAIAEGVLTVVVWRSLLAYQETLPKSGAITAEEAKRLFEQAAAAQGVKPGSALAALRIALTGGMSGPDLMQTIAILGAEETARRIDLATRALSVKSS